MITIYALHKDDVYRPVLVAADWLDVVWVMPDQPMRVCAVASDGATAPRVRIYLKERRT